MNCTNCGGTMVGDGYTAILHCENAAENRYQFHEPDANPVYCEPAEPETIEAPVIPGTFPVVLYLGNEEDREELIQALMAIHPNLRSRKL